MTPLNAELYDALISIKVPEEKARAAAAAIPPSELLVKKTDIPPELLVKKTDIPPSEQLVTKKDILPKEQIATKADIQSLNTRITMLIWMMGLGCAVIGIMIAVLGITIA